MKRSDGFTLVETVIALAVTSILMFIIIDFMTNSIIQYSDTEIRSQLLNEAQSSLDVISNDIRLSGNTDSNNRWSDNNAPGAPDDTYSWESDSDTFVLASAVEDTSGNIIFEDPALYIPQKNNKVYFKNNNTLYKRTIAAPVANNSTKTTCPSNLATSNCPADRVLLNNLNAFSVKYYNSMNQEVTPNDARSVEFYVKLQKIAYGRTISAEYSTRMVFRND